MISRTGLNANNILDDSRIVIFDCDDTILATASSRWHLLIETASIFDVKLTEQTIRKFWGLPFDELIRSIVPTVETAEFIGLYRQAMRGARPSPAAGAVELLEKLSRKGIVLEVVTSSSRDIIIQDLDQLDLTGYFANIYGQEQTIFHKPDPRVLGVVVESLRKRRLNILDAVFIGDSVRDYKAAAGNNIEFIAVLSGLESRQDFVRTGVAPDRIVDELTALSH